MDPIEAALLSNTTTSTTEVVKRWRQNQRDDRFAKRDTERALAAAMMAMMPIGITVMNKHHAFKFLKLFSVKFKEEDEEHTKRAYVRIASNRREDGKSKLVAPSLEGVPTEVEDKRYDGDQLRYAQYYL